MRQVANFFLVILLSATTLSVVKCGPNTGVNLLVCNFQSYAGNDPYANSVAYVLADLMNVAPSKQGYNYYTYSPYPTSNAYGHATCDQALANSECASCLVSARGTVSSSACSGRVGVQVELVDCSMRYENYAFS